jgi:hypothetical protein
LLLSPLVVAADPPAGRPAGRRIDFSDAGSNEASTNAVSAPRKLSNLPNLRDDLRGSLDLLKPDSLEGVPVPPPSFRIVIPNKRARDRMDLEKNWAFMKEEEIILGSSKSEDLFDTPASESKNKETRSRLEESYNRLRDRDDYTLPDSAKSKEDDRAASRKRQAAREDARERDDSGPLSRSKDRAQALKEAKGLEPGSDAFNSKSSHDAISDIFHLSNAATPDLFERAGRLKRQVEMKAAILGLPQSQGVSVAEPLDLFNSLDPMLNLGDNSPHLFVNPATDLISSRPSLPAGMESPAASAHSLLDGLPDLKASGDSSFLPAPPKIEPPQRSLTPPVPTFLAPKRAFF